MTLAIINTNYSSQIGLSPAKDGLFVEDKNSPYVNIFASRIDNKDSEKVKDLVKAYQTDEVAASAADIYKGDAVKAGNLPRMPVAPGHGFFILPPPHRSIFAHSDHKSSTAL